MPCYAEGRAQRGEHPPLLLRLHARRAGAGLWCRPRLWARCRPLERQAELSGRLMACLQHHAPGGGLPGVAPTPLDYRGESV